MRAIYAVLIGATGCSAMMADGDRNVFGDDLGRFTVTAELVESTCGAQALATPERWAFDVQMSREPDAIFWNQGADAVEGAIAADGVSFLVESVTEVPVTLVEGEPPSCVMNRQDTARGELDDDSLDVEGFSGELTYRFVQQASSQCDVLVGVAGGFEELPCRIRFTMAAERNLSPRDRR